MFKFDLDKLKFYGPIKKILSTLLKFLDKYYFVLIGLYFLKSAIKTARVDTGIDWKIYLFILAFLGFSAYKDVRDDVKWIPFLILAVPYLLLCQYVSVAGYAFWGKMIQWEMQLGVFFNWNAAFQHIPFNDASFARIWQPAWLTWFFRYVYNNGFVMPVMLCLYRACISKDFKKMLRYTLSAHIFQVFLITPFYVTFRLNEVWYVLGHADGLARNLSPEAAAGVTLNCFPSMHTSIAFATFLLVLRERNRIFKWVCGFFCLSVVFSTMYLEIHWVIDVIGGIILALVTVKLVDFVMDRGEKFIQGILKRYYYRNSYSTFESTLTNSSYSTKW